MAVPLTYNLRNLAVRRTTTLMTAFGIALTVTVLIGVLALVQGLRSSFTATGNPLHRLVMRRGSTSELTSLVGRSVFQDVKYMPGIARGRNGEPLASLEIVTGISLPSRFREQGVNITLRGLSPVGLEMRDYVHLASGRIFTPGTREVVVGRGVVSRHPEAGIGNKLKFGRGEWIVVGVFDGGRSAVNSEVFADLNQVASDYYRSEFLSSILIRAADEVTMEALRNNLESDRRFSVSAPTEKAYYESQTTSAAPIQYLGLFIAGVLAVGSSFAAMNTMYTAVSRRSAEIGTLRVLGFSRQAILASFLLESLLLSLLGGVIGCALALPMNHIQTGISSVLTFTEMVFDSQVTPTILAAGLGFALFMGTLGGLLPARLASGREIVASLRQT